MIIFLRKYDKACIFEQGRKYAEHSIADPTPQDNAVIVFSI